MGSQTSVNQVNEVGATKQGHSRLGLIKIIQYHNFTDIVDEDCQELMMINSIKMSKSQYQKWKDSIKMFQLQKIKDQILLPVKQEILSSGFCGSNCNINIYYPSYTMILRSEIQNRYGIGKMYDQQELWYLAYHLISAGQYFETIGRKIGNVHPTNVLISQKGWMKIISTFSIPAVDDNFSLICESQLEDVFLAPQEIDYDCFKHNLYPKDINANKAEAFSIGMTILEAATLQSSKKNYDRGPYRVNMEKVKQKMHFLMYKYSQKFIMMLQSLLAFKPRHRKTCKQIYQQLHPHEKQILQLEPFFKNTKNPEGDQSLDYSKSSITLTHNNITNLSNSKFSQTKLMLPPKPKPMPIKNPNPPPPKVNFYSPRYQPGAKKHF